MSLLQNFQGHLFQKNRRVYRIAQVFKGTGIALSMLLFPSAKLQNPAIGAERIYASYSILESSISVDALETYAKTGKLEGNLAYYARYLDPQQLKRLRRILIAPIDLGPVEVSQFLYTPIGETLLNRLGNVIKTEARQPGFYALRSALILAAAEPEGLTLLNILQKFPTRGIRIDLERSLDIASELESFVEQTNQAIALISQQSATAATPPPTVNFSQLRELRQPGQFTWDKQTLKLYDPQRDRRFLADLYLPNVLAPAPVIVISHGLGANRQSFAYLAQQLASYGFAVAVPEHPGSNSEQLQALLAGRVDEVTQPNEFINRPLDVKYLLDALERLDAANPNIQLNLQQVGAIGQSFGGYTVLALAGASLNVEQHQKQCQSLEDALNVSLLLQCKALQLPGTEYNLRDERIQAAIAINPITSIIFGEEGISDINIPVMLVSSSADKVAPALPEQIKPFTWLTNPEKYLVLLEGGTHFTAPSHTNSDAEPLPIPTGVTGPNPAIAHRYLDALSVAFFKTYVAGISQYRPYLSADYAQAISREPIPLRFVRSLPAELTQK
jgi:predicted dienelactone hydrolase